MAGKLAFFYGFQIQQEETRIFISQEKYARNLNKKFDLEQAKAKIAPTATHIKVSMDSGGKKVDESLYRNIIGSLLYIIASGPDIAYVAGIVEFRVWYLFDITVVLLGYCHAD
ncbi:putative mitochondrial protein [Cucumis melo var. makuwa]|uniref:Putative mitochondrial protein n=1 Tax=Cucumis melo var. makuwa TaxID=1194695 RepID=A0A5D3DFZ7_CUCMM|nr:putative mitochondrial protein [Cucumis melo var. makuwa]